MKPVSTVVSVLSIAFMGAAVCGAAPVDEGKAVELKPLATGAMRKIGGYMPQRIELSTEKPASIKKSPADLISPMYGSLPLGEELEGNKPARSVLVLLDEPDDADARLFVDSNSNGDLTDDPATEWTSKPVDGPEGKQFKQYGGGATIELGDAANPFAAHVGMYRFDKTDPRREGQKNTLFYYRDYAREGSIELAGAEFKAMLVDDRTSGDFRGKAGEEQSGVQLLIDVNKNGKFDSRGERFDIRTPFNIGGTTYEVVDMVANGASFRLVKSDKVVEEISTPPDHAAGKTIMAFSAKQMDGNTVNFPGDYKGKIVMLDFWATWCGPCMMEVPGLVRTYKAHHENGFEILGVTLDKEDAVVKINDVMSKREMTWPQIYDGKYWKAEIAQKYAINSIPAAFLVDGDTGAILASGDSLRGEELEATVKAAMEKKAGGKK